MKSTVMIVLIGQQPIPNLLPIRYIEPTSATLVYSDFTESAAVRLSQLVKNELEVWRLPINNAYDIAGLRNALAEEIEERQLQSMKLAFNVTGGTKPMSLAAYLVAADISADFLYLPREGKRTRL